MGLIGLVLRLLQPPMSLALLVLSPLTQASPARAKHKLQKLAAELPEGFWAKLHFLWETPTVKSIRITASVANWGVRLPAIAALLLTQGSLLASQVSLPMLAPLLLGTGMMVNSIKKNASFVFPRLGLLVVLLWLLWFVNSVIQNTWMVLLKQGRIDARTMSGARMITECSSLLLAGVLVLSALGININALLLPTGVVLAIASKDLLQNLIAGLYLVLVQPFRLGDKVAVSCSLPTSHAANGSSGRNGAGSLAGGGSSSSGGSGLGSVQGWFEGVCEKVDLRYTVLRDGRRRLMVPNNSFISREFLVYDDVLSADAARLGGTSSAAGSRGSSPWPGSSSSSTAAHDAQAGQYATAYGASSGGPVEPSIREGHMTTELPPLAPPIFPGMTYVAPGYAQYGPAHYAPYAAYQQLQQLQQQQQQDEEDEESADAEEEADSSQQQQADSSPDPAAAAAAAGSSLAASLSSGVGAASAAAAAAGAAMRHLPAQQLGGLAQQAAGGLLGQVGGMCREVGQSLGELP
ncbi:hypothetical protein OEZ86_011368 [Tetradesmus obliquus]|nr:hypothetical protein OEZ86_011368 [Tetradesmus obliquus]